ncbi:hypothetical protein SPRG_21437 [Saprolegnia parasitica CBS 223.65]|uniref:Apple domain-containing protein n=1 Tax=Saprolegnia parasitica (strain CBS 223.65) TaxID=695850 RepID=A0A067C0P6_SAPPC|nr:hypothetical protein SPRG_21437 [Saprolegnia parasitica CBS 223.65]KDO20126.1 hypothetical protein SPRG_21437 [Saprolegnia parasitica CBS 223.65]|eukprot:XP_012209182.1 hypothetical protein SPRG_21437 [Saprolegnia parasitica CBS 223.65]
MRWVSGLLVALGVTVHAQTLDAGVCANVVHNYDYPGNDIASIKVSGTDQAQYSACCDACANKDGCAGFVVNSKTCYMKSKMVQSGYKAGLMSGTYSFTSETCSSLKRDIDYAGNDIRSLTVKGNDQAQADLCCDACSNTISCIGWVVNGNTCYLKHKMVYSGADTGLLSGKYTQPKIKSETCGNLIQDVDYSGNDIRDFAVKGSPQDQTSKCCDACSKQDGCVGFVTHSNTCWLKKAWVKSGTKIGAMAGTFTAPLPTSDTCSAITRGTDYPGNDIRSFTVTGSDQARADACCDACTKQNGCVGWITHSNTCWLKRKMANASPLPTALAGTYAAPLPTSDTCSAITRGTDYPGNDIRSFTVTGSDQARADACCDACTKQSGCSKMANASPLPTALAGTYAAPLPTSDTCSAITRGTDYPGNDIRSFTVTGSDQARADACCDACTKQSGCVGWITHSSTSTCWLKSKMANASPLPTGARLGPYAAPLPTSDTCSAITRGTDYPGNDIRSFGVSGTEQDQTDKCCTVCSNTISCVGWIVYSNTCWLKHKLGAANALPTALSGQYVQPAISSGTCGNLVQDVDYAFNDIKNFAVTGSPQDQTNQCCDACSALDSCAGFVTHANLCWLKHKMVRSGPMVGAMAGTAPLQVPTSQVCGAVTTGVNYPGNDIVSFAINGTRQDQTNTCCDACTKTTGCLGFVLHDKTCWLKSVLTNLTPLSSAVSGTFVAGGSARRACYA